MGASVNFIGKAHYLESMKEGSGVEWVMCARKNKKKMHIYNPPDCCITSIPDDK